MVLDFAPVEGIFMQINKKTFGKFITMNLVRKICSYCSISQFLTFIARFLHVSSVVFYKIAKRTWNILLLWIWIFSYSTYLVEKCLCSFLTLYVEHKIKVSPPSTLRFIWKNKYPYQRNISCPKRNISDFTSETLVYNIWTVCSFPHGHARKVPEVLRVKISSQMFEFK